MGGLTQGLDARFQDTDAAHAMAGPQQTTPTSMQGRHTFAFRGSQQHGQAVGHHDGTNNPWLGGETAVGRHRQAAPSNAINGHRCPQARQPHDAIAMNLVEPNGVARQGIHQNSASLGHCVGIVTHMVTQVELVIRRYR